MQKVGKLELTWVGKYNEKALEPRILIEDESKSSGDPLSENMLIHGDNLIALQALQQDFSGRIKCIYIDPPYKDTTKYRFTFDPYEAVLQIWNDVPIYISEGYKMDKSEKSWLLSKGRSKGNISGNISKLPSEEWLNLFR